MRKLTSLFSIESLSAVLAWAVVSGSALFLMWQSREFPLSELILTGGLALTFLFAFLYAIHEEGYQNRQQLQFALMALQYVAVMGMAYLVPFNYIAILITIWSAQIPYFMGFGRALLLSPFWSAPIWFIYLWHWQSSQVLLMATLFWTFNIFALVMVNATIKEQRSAQKALELNRQLVSTQSLLNEASKQSERVRIARNIHDLLGHHLTALTINLQVAARISEGEAQQRVKQCHALAKLLLSDVREAVSEIRQKSNLALVDALHELIANVPQLQIDLDFRQGITISDVEVAQVILRAVQESITNTLKHSNGSRLAIKVAKQGDWIRLDMQDNGSSAPAFTEGNGLTGMRERISQLGGQLHFNAGQDGFKTHILLPEAP